MIIVFDKFLDIYLSKNEELCSICKYHKKCNKAKKAYCNDKEEKEYIDKTLLFEEVLKIIDSLNSGKKL